jgi:heme-degrading monooxygenase HmoA
MIERHIDVEIPSHNRAAFERFFVERYRPAAASLPGYVACVLLRESERPERYQMVFRWETADEAKAWRTSAVHERLQPELTALHAGMTITAYEMVS